MTQGDVGVSIEVNFGGYVATGATATFLAAPGYPYTGQTPTVTAGTMTVSSDGTYATYTTTGTDFTTAGNWSVQVQLTHSGTVLTTAPGMLYVAPLL